MKVDVVALIIVAIYHILVKFNVTIFKKFITIIDIIVYDETFIVQTQIVNITKVYFSF